MVPITERLACRVKGLTADFCIFLWTEPAPTCHPAVFLRDQVAAAA